MSKKIFLISFIIVCTGFSIPAFAQLKGFSIGPYFEAAWPKNDFHQMNANGIGAGLAADVKLGSKLNLMGSVGYLRFGRQSNEALSKPISAVPLRVGLKYKLPIIYVKLESGTARMNNDLGNALILSPGVGFRILGLDVQGSYESWLADEGRSFASLKIAYHF